MVDGDVLVRTTDAAVDAPVKVWLPVKDAAALLGVHWQTCYRWIHRGSVEVQRSPGGRYKVSQDWVDRFKRGEA